MPEHLHTEVTEQVSRVSDAIDRHGPGERLRQCKTRVGVALLMLGTITLSGCERYALDVRMVVLCRKDGGVKVYETVTLSPQEYDAVIGYRGGGDWKKRESFYGPNYRLAEKSTILFGTAEGPLHGRGRLMRFYSAIYRRSDNKLLGESVEYGRSGGDFFTFGLMPSANGCPKPRVDLGLSVFKRRG